MAASATFDGAAVHVKTNRQENTHLLSVSLSLLSTMIA